MSSAWPFMDKATTFDLFARYVSPGKARFFQQVGIDFVMGKREGPFIWDVSGEKRLIDCHCNGGVFNLGHRHPAIVEALRASLESLDIGNHHLVSDLRARLGQRLAELTPGDLTYTVFGVSGGEAIDLAIKVARGYTGRTKVISAKGGYHGHTGLALAAGDEKYRKPFGPLAPGFLQVPFNDLDTLAEALDDDTAAVILETVPATYGMPIPAPDYLPGVRELCDRHAAVLIIDEVQTGLGRTGKLWGVEHFGVVPDILVTGKGLSGGIFPMTATILRPPLMRVFEPDPFIHVSTFGGAEVGVPVALQVLDISSQPEFLAHVQALADFFRERFKPFEEKYKGVYVRLRQLGLMMGIEMSHPQAGPLFSKMAYEAGILSVYANNDPRVAQLLPPLTIDFDVAEEIVARVDKALELVANVMGGG